MHARMSLSDVAWRRNFPKVDGTVWTVQPENRFALAANHVYVSRAMVVAVDDNPKSIKP